MMRLARNVCIMLMLAGAAFCFWTLFQDGFHRWILPQARGQSLDLHGLCSVARSIYEEAGRDKRAAEKLARERGFTSQQIWAAKKFCKGA